MTHSKQYVFWVTASSQLKCSATEWSGGGFSASFTSEACTWDFVAAVFCLFYLCISTSGRFFHPHFLYHLPWYYQQENSVVRYIFTTRCQSIRSKHILIFKSKHECRVMTQAQLLHHRPPICFQCASEAAKCPILCSQNGLRICSSVLLRWLLRAKAMAMPVTPACVLPS